MKMCDEACAKGAVEQRTPTRGVPRGAEIAEPCSTPGSVNDRGLPREAGSQLRLVLRETARDPRPADHPS